MAGGTFNPLVGKDRPGTYINFKSAKTDTSSIGSRGIVAVPLLNHSWGPTGEFIRLDAGAPDAHRVELGFSIYDSDTNRQMLLLREAFKKAATVYVYRCNGGSGVAATAAPADSQPATATAKYKGTRGNDLSYSIIANPAVTNGFDVTISLGGSVVSEYTGLKTVAELIAKNDAYITFTGTGNLTATAAAVSLTGGTDVAADNSAVTTFLDALEGIRFNTLAFPTTTAALQTAAKTKIQYIRESVGRGVQVVMPDATDKDYEGVISVTNSVKVDGVSLTNAEACAWVAAATAAAGNTKSNTYEPYEGATEVVNPKNHEQAVAAIQNGEFFFSVSEAGVVVVEYDINTLTSFTDGKDKSYRKNRVIRVFDTFAESIQTSFPPNRFSNEEVGWGVMEGLGRAILKQYEEAGAITEVDSEGDFLVDRGKSAGDETYFNVGLKPVDSAEKLYFQISTR